MVSHGVDLTGVLRPVREGNAFEETVERLLTVIKLGLIGPGERFPAGDYPNQDPGGAGLPAWTKANRPIGDTDVVLWYTVSSNHITRPEDWPVMPAKRAGSCSGRPGF